MVPSLTIAMMIICVILGIAMPVGLFVYLKKKYDLKFKVFLYGALTFVVFAGIIEGFINNTILYSSFGSIFTSNIFMYGLFGGFMAGVFEEGGRFIVLKYVLKDELDNDKNALMFGAGHGGIEAIMVFVLTYVSYIIYAFMINSGQLEMMLDTLDPSSANQVEMLMYTLIGTPWYVFIMALVERALAISAHLCFATIVFKSVKDKKIMLLVIAIVLHMLLDTISVIAATFLTSPIILEMIVGLLTLLIFFVTKNLCVNQ